MTKYKQKINLIILVLLNIATPYIQAKMQPWDVKYMGWFYAIKTADFNRVQNLHGGRPMVGTGGFNVDVRDQWGNTALIHNAVHKAGIDCFRYLLAQGADINAQNNNGDTALLCSVRQDNIPAIKYLLEQGACSSLKDSSGQNALHISVKNRSMESVKWLVQSGMYLNSKDKNGNTALALSLSDEEDISIPTYLISKNANLKAQNDKGETALMLSIKKGYRTTAVNLISKDANLDAINQHGDTALALAVKYADLSLVQFLIKHNANIETTGNNHNVFYWAKISGRHDIVKYMENLYQILAVGFCRAGCRKNTNIPKEILSIIFDFGL